MLKELLDALIGAILNTDPNGKPRAIVRVPLGGLQDPIVVMLHTWWASQAVQGRRHNKIGIDLIGLCIDDIAVEGMVQSLCQLLELALVHRGCRFRSLTLVS